MVELFSWVKAFDKRILVGESSVVPIDRILDEVGDHLSIRGVVLRTNFPAKLAANGFSNPGLELFPGKG